MSNTIDTFRLATFAVFVQKTAEATLYMVPCILQAFKKTYFDTLVSYSSKLCITLASGSNPRNTFMTVN